MASFVFMRGFKYPKGVLLVVTRATLAGAFSLEEADFCVEHGLTRLSLHPQTRGISHECTLPGVHTHSHQRTFPVGV